ncbi:14649_t:CDS:2, partial [Entrophospora sp. SA101]
GMNSKKQQSLDNLNLPDDENLPSWIEKFKLQYGLVIDEMGIRKGNIQPIQSFSSSTNLKINNINLTDSIKTNLKITNSLLHSYLLKSDIKVIDDEMIKSDIKVIDDEMIKFFSQEVPFINLKVENYQRSQHLDLNENLFTEKTIEKSIDPSSINNNEKLDEMLKEWDEIHRKIKESLQKEIELLSKDQTLMMDSIKFEDKNKKNYRVVFKTPLKSDKYQIYGTIFNENSEKCSDIIIVFKYFDQYGFSIIIESASHLV